MNDISVTELRIQKQLDYTRKELALRQKLTMHCYVVALAALDYSAQHHTGYRKDGFTPDHMHPVRVATSMADHRLHFLKGGINPDVAIASGLCHDIPEENRATSTKNRYGDTGLTRDVMAGELFDRIPKRLRSAPEIQSRIAAVVETAFALDKYQGSVQPVPALMHYKSLLKNPLWMETKLFDRLDNFGTILELPAEKQVGYVTTTRILLGVAEEMHALYPKLDPITRSCERQIHEQVDTYLRFASMVQYGDGMRIVEALEENGMLQRPVASSSLQVTGCAAG